LLRFPKGLYNPCFFSYIPQKGEFQAMKKGTEVLGLIVILLIIGSAFVGVITAEEIIIDTEIGES
jgi:hypothetical protein